MLGVNVGSKSETCKSIKAVDIEGFTYIAANQRRIMNVILILSWALFNYCIN